MYHCRPFAFCWFNAWALFHVRHFAFTQCYSLKWKWFFPNCHCNIRDLQAKSSETSRALNCTCSTSYWSFALRQIHLETPSADPAVTFCDSTPAMKGKMQTRWTNPFEVTRQFDSGRLETIKSEARWTRYTLGERDRHLTILASS